MPTAASTFFMAVPDPCGGKKGTYVVNTGDSVPKNTPAEQTHKVRDRTCPVPDNPLDLHESPDGRLEHGRPGEQRWRSVTDVGRPFHAGRTLDEAVGQQGERAVLQCGRRVLAAREPERVGGVEHPAVDRDAAEVEPAERRVALGRRLDHGLGTGVPAAVGLLGAYRPAAGVVGQRDGVVDRCCR